MKVTTSSKGMKIDPSLQKRVEDKLRKFDRYFGDDATAGVKFTRENDRIVVEITMHIQNRFYRGEKESEDPYQALDLAIEVMERQIRKHKNRIEKRIRDHSYMKEYLKDQATTREEEDFSNIVRRKSFELIPMDPEEATLQMEMLGHSFLLFLNAEDAKVNLVYMRKDGNYGLIEPKY